MFVHIHDDFKDHPAAQEAAALTGACVHCGFCLATCPTYLDNRDERDSPRGRIYLIKSLLETASGAHAVETPPGSLPDLPQLRDHLPLGRGICAHCRRRAQPGRRPGWAEPAAAQHALAPAPGGAAPRPVHAAAAHRAEPARRDAGALRQHVPPRQRRLPATPRSQPRRMVLLAGCVQRAATPRTNDAARLVFDKLGIELITCAGEGCCGAVNHHLGAHAAARANMRHNIDVLWPHIENGAEAVISSATGCGLQVADYGRLLADDPVYRDKAARVSALFQDIADALVREDLAPLAPSASAADAIAVHTPCSQQHGLQQPHTVQADHGPLRLPPDTDPGGSSVLRLRRHLLPAAAGNQRASAGTQTRRAYDGATRAHCDGECRLPAAPRRGSRDTGSALDRMPRRRSAERAPGARAPAY